MIGASHAFRRRSGTRAFGSWRENGEGVPLPLADDPDARTGAAGALEATFSRDSPRPGHL
jgi:hypothetical protein